MGRIAAALAVIAALTAALAARAGAETFPARTIRLVVPFPAGGPADVMGRLMAQTLSVAFGQQAIVDNRPGGGSTIGGREVARAEPDGYTLLVGSAATLAIGPTLFRNIGYDPATSFAPFRLYNIGNNQPVQLLRYIEVIEEALGKKAIKNFLPLQAGDVAETFADIDDLVRDVGYRPATPVEVGVRRFVEWFCEYYGYKR